MNRKSSCRILALVVSFAFFAIPPASADRLSSPTWGFHLDLPEGFELAGGDGKSRFSFVQTQSGVSADFVAYAAGRYADPEALAADAIGRLSATGDKSSFDYRGRAATVARIEFRGPAGPTEGWLLAIELGPPGSLAGGRPLLLALAYGAAGTDRLDHIGLSVLDSLAPSAEDRLFPGPVSVFSFPAEGRESVRLTIGDTAAEAPIDASDKAASKALVDREFAVLATYSNSPLWKEAWARFYRAIWRDAYDRLTGIAFAVERELGAGTDRPTDRVLAERALAWVQDFRYERDLLGSDFVDLISAATERRGDCDSRALLFAVILQKANIDAILMVSRDYGHAMAAVRVEGTGAKFKHGETDWIVAETTAKVPLGLIGKNVSDTGKWLGIDFPALGRAD